MMFFKMVWYDLKNGLLKGKWKYLFFMGLSLIICIDFRLRWNLIDSLNVPSYGDFLMYIFSGMKEYIPSPMTQFRYPEIWILVMLLTAYQILYYPYRDLSGMGKQVLINSKSRIGWWFSKCVWILCSVFVFFGIFWMVSLLFCLVTGGKCSLEISIRMYQYLGITIMPDMPSELNIQIFLLPLLVMSSLGLMQMTLSFFIKPFYSFAVTITIFVVSCYYMNPWVIGNYAMVQRSSLLVRGGMEAVHGICLALLLSAVSVGIGLLFFRRYDILERE